MQIQSLLSKTQIKFLACLILVLLGTTLGLVLPKNYKPAAAYHQSQWNGYAPEIDRAFGAKQSVSPSNLEHVYGGIVPHHIPQTIPQLVEFYSRLKKTQPVKNFVIIGPDHTDAGKAPAVVSNASFFTAYGEVKSVEGLALKLQDAGLAYIDELPFDTEHSVGSQILVISKIFPEAGVTPIILRSDATKNHAIALGKMLAEIVDDETVLIASVDFSHYLSAVQALSIDRISREIVRNLDLKALSLIKADSNRALEAYMHSMNEKKAVDTDGLVVLNTNDLMQNSDNTTGYVFGFWGIEP